jgi:hypothetical protein
VHITRDSDLKLYQLAAAAELVIAKTCELKWDGFRSRRIEIDDASLLAHQQVIALLEDGETLLFPQGGYVVQVVGVEHMVAEESGLPMEAIRAKGEAGHPGAQVIHRELTEGSGVVVRQHKTDDAGVTFAVECPSNDGWVAERRQRWRDALEAALDLAAHRAERMLSKRGSLGMILLPLDARLKPLEALEIPLDMIPPTAKERRKLMEALANPGLRGATGYIGIAECVRHRGEQPAERSHHPSAEEAAILQAETRAGDCCCRVYRIVRKGHRRPKLKLVERSFESPPGVFCGLMEAADASPEGPCLDDSLLNVALASHADTIGALGDEDMLMFAVGEQLVQVIGPERRVRKCTMLRLADIKAKAIAGDKQAQKGYYQLTAGSGMLLRAERAADGQIRYNLTFPDEND